MSTAEAYALRSAIMLSVAAVLPASVRADVPQQLEVLMREAAAARPQSAAEQRVGTYYASYLDQVHIDALDLAPMEGRLAEVRAAKSWADLAVVMGHGNRIFAPFEADVLPDGRVAIGQSGLDLGEPQRYADPSPAAQVVRGKWVDYLADMLLRLGEADARPRAEAILAMQARYAEVSRPQDSERESAADMRRWSRAELKALAPGFDWDRWLASNGLADADRFAVAQPDVIKGIAAAMAATDYRVMRDYLLFSLVCTWADFLPHDLREAQAAFYGRTLGRPGFDAPRAERAVRRTRRALGDDVDALYAARFFPAASRRRVEAIVAAWTPPAGKARPVIHVGYPESLGTRQGPEVRPGDALGNAQRAEVWAWRRKIAAHGRSEPGRWRVAVTAAKPGWTGGALFLPAGLLQPPLFDPAADDGANAERIRTLLDAQMKGRADR